ncbi:MAG: hypothetical protein VYB05_11970 [Pseudomonadota bacterium]|nr:hypothetical protein [Pseudomonadota bacterium]
MSHPGHNDIHRAASDPHYRVNYEQDRRQHEFRKDIARLKEQDLSRRRGNTGGGGSTVNTGDGLTIPQMLVSGAVLFGLAWVFVPILFRMFIDWLGNLASASGAAIAANWFDMAAYGLVIVLVLVAIRAFVELRPHPIAIAGGVIVAAIALLSYLLWRWSAEANTSPLIGQILLWGFPIYSATLACIVLPVSKDMYGDLSLRDFVPTLARTFGIASILIWSILIVIGSITGDLGELLWGFFWVTGGVMLIAAALSALQFVNLLVIWMHQRV